MTTVIGPTVSVRFVVSLLSIVTLADASAAEPERANGLSVHMLPDRLAQIDGRSGGFIVRDSGGESIYSDAQALLFFSKRSRDPRAKTAFGLSPLIQVRIPRPSGRTSRRWSHFATKREFRCSLVEVPSYRMAGNAQSFRQAGIKRRRSS